MIYAEYIENEMNGVEFSLITETIKKKFVVRNGKRVAKYKTTRPGDYRIQYIDGKPKEVKMSPLEKKKREIGQKKAKIKRKAKKASIQKKRHKSFVARKNVGLEYNKEFPDKNSYSDD